MPEYLNVYKTMNKKENRQPQFLFRLIVASFLVCFPVTCFADYVLPELTRVSTSKYETPLIANAGRYIYSITWQGIPVANADVVIGETPQLRRTDYVPQPGDQTIRVSTKTAKVIDLLYKLRHTSESIFNPKEVRPISFTSDQTENSKYKRWEVLFSQSNQITSKLYKEPNAEVSESYQFNSDNFTLDPLFGALVARSVQVKAGSDVSVDIWNGKHRYLIEFKVEGQDYIEIENNKILADRIIPTVKKLTDSEGEKRIKSCTMWVSADERREILKLDSKVFLGRITATLKSIQPITSPTLSSPVLEAAVDRSKTDSMADSGRAMLNVPEENKQN
jgi:hypothetical protein